MDMETIAVEITSNISSSKGWGRYRVLCGGKPVMQSRTGNEWVSAGHSGEVEDGATLTVTLQTMQRVGKYKREEITTTDYTLIAEPGAIADLGDTWQNSLGIRVKGARLNG